MTGPVSLEAGAGAAAAAGTDSAPSSASEGDAPAAGKSPRVGEPVTAEGWSAQVAQAWSADREETVWAIEVWRGEGQARRGLLIHLSADRAQPFTLAWERPGEALRLEGEETSGYAIVCADGVRVVFDSWESPRLLDPESAVPLEADVQRRLQVLPKRAKVEELRMIRLDGEYMGASSVNFVCLDPKVLLVLGPNYQNHAGLIASGPILAHGDHWGDVASGRWVFFDGVEPRVGDHPVWGRPIFVRGVEVDLDDEYLAETYGRKPTLLDD